MLYARDVALGKTCVFPNSATVRQTTLGQCEQRDIQVFGVICPIERNQNHWETCTLRLAWKEYKVVSFLLNLNTPKIYCEYRIAFLSVLRYLIVDKWNGIPGHLLFSVLFLFQFEDMLIKVLLKLRKKFRILKV